MGGLLCNVAVQGVDIGHVKNQLLAVDIELEEFGGDVPVLEVSAKSGMGMDDLQHALHLQAENLELQARVDCDAEAVVVEVSSSPLLCPFLQTLHRSSFCEE